MIFWEEELTHIFHNVLWAAVFEFIAGNTMELGLGIIYQYVTILCFSLIKINTKITTISVCLYYKGPFFCYLFKKLLGFSTFSNLPRSERVLW